MQEKMYPKNTAFSWLLFFQATVLGFSVKETKLDNRLGMGILENRRFENERKMLEYELTIYCITFEPSFFAIFFIICVNLLV